MRSIFITGAGAGIGLATARLFAEKGWFIGAADFNPSALNALQNELGEKRCSIHVMDVTHIQSVQDALAAFTQKTNGKIDVLHNNAGVINVGRFETIPLTDHHKITQVNINGLMTVLHSAFPYLKQTPNALVINMSSASATYGIPDFASYSASKHAVRALTEALDIEWEEYGIRVCDMMPPFVNTSMVQSNQSASRIFKRLGVKLNANHVAAEVWNMTNAPKLHYPISLQFKSVFPLARLAPPRVMRALLKKVWR